MFAPLLLVVTFVGGLWWWKQRKITPDEPSLYTRLGGIFAIAMVVNRFSDQVLENTKVGKNSLNPALRQWSREQAATRLPGLKWMRTLWVADVSGGPYKYVPTKPGCETLGLESAHCPFHITPEEFDEVANELSLALLFYKVPDRERQEVLAAFAGHKKEVSACAVATRPPSCPFKLN